MRRLKNQAPNNLVSYGYFFDKLTSSEWLQPLAAEGLFRRPAALEHEGDMIRFVPWPQARYLSRVAGSAPEAVVDIILAIPDTDNVSVLVDLAEAACSMPPDQGARLIDKAVEWTGGSYAGLTLLPHGLGKLIAHLAAGGFAQEALRLARGVLALKKPSDEVDDTPNRRPLSGRTEAVLNDWDYKEIIRLRMPTLVEAADIEALRLLSDLLDEALTNQRVQEQEETGAQRFLEDYSTIWRPNLTAGRRSDNEDVLNALVSGIRAATRQITREHPELLDDVIIELEKRRWIVFWRISLDLLHEMLNSSANLACTLLKDGAIANEHGLESEYLELLGAAFAGSSMACQGEILELIKAGPDVSDLREGGDADFCIRRWRWQRLAAIKDFLPIEWLHEWQQLSAEFGETLQLRREGITAYAGPPEAVGVTRLNEMTIPEIISFVNRFEPGDGFDEPSTEDLARELGQAVAADPARFEKEVLFFHGIDLVYKGRLVHGYRDAAENSKEFDWNPVIALCHNIVTEAGVATGQVPASVRREVTDLLHSALAPKGLEVPFKYRHRVWELLAVLIEDPDPSLEREVDDNDLDPYGSAINTTRGRALEAAVYYGIWVYRHTESNRETGDTFTFTEAPELSEALERHLDPQVDSSLAIRSVYGVYLPTLNGLDHRWVCATLPQLFPPHEAAASLRKATWEAYVRYSRLDLSMLKLLREEYAKSIELLGSMGLEGRRNPAERLGGHLMVFYWHGRLTLDDPLLVSFFRFASGEARSQSLANVGQYLRGNSEPLGEDVATRLRALWEWRIQTAQTDQTIACEGEMAAFGWTFASGKLGDVWGLQQLETAVRIAGQMQADHLVAEQIAHLADGYPGEAMRCFALMVDGAKETWQIQHWTGELETALAAALRSGVNETIDAARILVHRLGARGFLQFADLLRDSG